MDEETIFWKAAELSGDERANFLSEACGDNAELRVRVEKLLEAHDGSESFLENVPDDLKNTLVEEPGSKDQGKQNGRGNGGKFEDRYQLTGLLGKGGMGAVYQAVDRHLERTVAIKILPQEFGENEEALERFHREAKALAALNHPNIVLIFDYGQTGEGQPYFVMEFIDGMNIHQLREGGHLDLPGALEIVSQVCAALHYAHGKGIIHRDIKPANVMINSDGMVKVADFGLAKSFGTKSRPNHDPALTQTGAKMGTPDYMAPEQLSGQHVDHRADIYALGAMLYDLLTGAPPRGAWMTPAQKVQVDVRLDEIVVRALQENPVARYQAASEVKEDVDAVKTTTGGAPIPPGVAVDPLPSSGIGVVPTPAPGNSPPARPDKQKKSQKSQSRPGLLASFHSAGCSVTIVAALGIVVLGGLAVHLSQRETGDHYDIDTNITYQEIENYFTNLINVGDVDDQIIQMFTKSARPYGSWVVALSDEVVTAEEARKLASQAGAEILDVARQPEDQTDSPATWLPDKFGDKLGEPAWVQENGKLRPFAAGGLIGNGSSETPSTTTRRVFLCWQPTPEMLEPKPDQNGVLDSKPSVDLPPTNPEPEPIQAKWEFRGPLHNDVRDALPVTTTERTLFKDQLTLTTDYVLHIHGMMGNDFNIAVRDESSEGYCWTTATQLKSEDTSAKPVPGAEAQVSLSHVRGLETVSTVANINDSHRINRTEFIDLLIVRSGHETALFAGDAQSRIDGDIGVLSAASEPHTVEVFRGFLHDLMEAPTAMAGFSCAILTSGDSKRLLQCDSMTAALEALPKLPSHDESLSNALIVAINSGIPKPSLHFPLKRTLTNNKGISLEVELLSANTEKVTFIKLESGTEHTVKLDTLSETDREFVKSVRDQQQEQP